MSQSTMATRYFPSSPSGVVRELRQLGNVALCTLRLLANHNRVSNTQRYGSELCQLTYFRTTFQTYLDEDRSRVARWKRRQVFIDYMPDCEPFKCLPHDTVGFLYYRMCAEHAEQGRPDLRELRLQTLPEEAEGLDLTRGEHVDDPEAFFRWIVARRNIASSAGHDYRHLITGSDTGVVGEALMGRYEYKHLREPGRWMNMTNAVALLTLTGRWHTVRKVRKAFRVIDQSRDITTFDLDRFWDRPLRDARRELGLPPEGLMPAGRLPE
jgi:ubiquinone biosynthesis protein Coq4